MSGRASIGSARDDASSAARAASQAAAGRGLRRRAAPVRARSLGGRRHLGRLAPPGRGPLCGQAAPTAGRSRQLATQAQRFAAAVG